MAQPVGLRLGLAVGPEGAGPGHRARGPAAVHDADPGRARLHQSARVNRRTDASEIDALSGISTAPLRSSVSAS